MRANRLRTLWAADQAAVNGWLTIPRHANKTVVAFAMIETAQALDNLDSIHSVEGLDAIYIGPSDLSLSLGCKPVFDDVEPKAQQAIEPRNRSWTRPSGLRCGVLARRDDAAASWPRGGATRPARRSAAQSGA